ncbi:diaminohydroxyphosphoribosylaminopyrimidine deaminase [Desulfonatronum thiosulfatophilum]|uniref:Riboflavin biosynthesis protein RibD n=1 Tax=Desulfonatronum thiosulfatophilum TaxID=617002 RepID=A0A1G6DWT2_9BACT|nr:bifunctional diaminohydroxyphosphoribosylaminopyrimidine deaminase/5-amino-6-(5-phosphoribosylamino)uracil reductase RibD [Desulfonatronum thiosulfatophilum]SDB49614.1 diaminohydroxyphosphoribosylaminopyrimidine deaminase [Desulfonatronum thiosulfatophilum]
MNSFPLPDNAEAIMLEAVALAELGKGLTVPNPCVGAVLTRDGQIVAKGYHHGPGQAHAEVEALRDARERGVDPRECILWVTLEPCNHTGRTPPCTQAIIQAGVSRVVVGATDPNPRVVGGGIAFLLDHGVQVVTGIAETACEDLIADFLTWVHTPCPYLYLKLAATLDGRIAARSGDSQWITNAVSRAMVHELRGRAQAVMVGAGTLRVDNPRLTCRGVSGAAPQSSRFQPLAVVVGSSLPEPGADLFLLRERPMETIFLTTVETASSARADDLRELGVRVWGAGTGDLVDLRSGLVRLRSELGVMDVLCEGGGGLAQHLVSENLVGEWWLFLAPKTLGDAQAVSMLSGSTVERMNGARHWRTARVRRLENDLLLVLRPDDMAAGKAEDKERS